MQSVWQKAVFCFKKVKTTRKSTDAKGCFGQKPLSLLIVYSKTTVTVVGPVPASKKLSALMQSDSVIIIPTYNEKENIRNIITAVFDLNGPYDVLVIDDCSPDGTAEIVKGMQG